MPCPDLSPDNVDVVDSPVQTLAGEEGKKWDAREIDWSLQDFLKLYLSLSPEKQAQVMAFTGFISEGGKDTSEEDGGRTSDEQ